MMLGKDKLVDAIRYNSKRVGKIWVAEDLPFPLNDHLDWAEFTAWVCAYQAVAGLKIDGKLGSITFEAIRISRDEDALNDPGPSNNVIINGKRHRIPDEMIARGYTVRNFLDDGVEKFRCRPRRKALRHFVLHETCGNTALGCERTLRKKKYGVQLIEDHKGCYTQYGDLVVDRMVHANQLNETSFGVEVVNPYNPVYVTDGRIWNNWIPRRWWTWVPAAKNVLKLLKRKGWKKVPKEYVTPTHNQRASMKLFAPWLVAEIGLFNYDFPTIDRRKTGKIKFPKPGVVAHSDFASHADGRYMLEALYQESKGDQ